ncbi:Protein CrcB homolog 2 [uncultured Mycobacterium sp.]|uniref:Fluoride-specific ion channel FluC n=1 Tax=uncultured Mycobacterium sp. TaxID=171292 RepID=A0A1Y5PPU9_9MYCO|nr:Protein CrcB homolog 2 [uncultured Mycobacterium sp.]
MTVWPWFAALVAGGFGAVLRFTIDRFVMSRTGGSFPWGTFTVNVTGSLVLGTLAGLALPASLALIAGTGIVGSYTTFSTWMLESHRLGEERQRRLAAINVCASIALGVLAAAFGQYIGEHL